MIVKKKQGGRTRNKKQDRGVGNFLLFHVDSSFIEGAEKKGEGWGMLSDSATKPGERRHKANSLATETQAGIIL